ncbi:1407_t:CDS:2, partial [Scutellospora calospora]
TVTNNNKAYAHATCYAILSLENNSVKLDNKYMENKMAEFMGGYSSKSDNSNED